MVKFKLKQSCAGCPETYNVYLDNVYVGYLRLRNGYFNAYYSDRNVYSASPKGDGIFEYDERDFYLNEACKAIRAAIENEKLPKEDLIFEISYE